MGPATAQKWYNAGMRSVKDVLLRLDGNEIKDSRLIYGEFVLKNMAPMETRHSYI